jgi:hypothetical protein
MLSTDTQSTVNVPSATALDGVAFVLFVVFVALLLLGYFGWFAGIPFSPFAAAALAVALASLLWANVLEDRREALTPPTGS